MSKPCGYLARAGITEQCISAQIKNAIADTVWHSICIYIHKEGNMTTGSTILDIGIVCMLILLVTETIIIINILT